MLAPSDRVAFVSDVHGNIDALDAVLNDIQTLGIEQIICLGDVVGYGAAPSACVKAIRERCEVVVMGNHEAMTVFDDVVYLDELPLRIKRPIELARKELTDEETDWMRKLPMIVRVEEIAAVHSSLFIPAEFHYIFTPEDARRHFSFQEDLVSFHGHSHVPMIWEEVGRDIRSHTPRTSQVTLSKERRYSINVGSVGQPRDGDPRACYVVYDHARRDVTFRRVPYDIEAARKKIIAATISIKNAERLEIGE